MTDLLDAFVRPLDHSGMRYEVGDLAVRFAPPEYVIIRKLEFFREGGSTKHLRDIASMLTESGDSLDDPFLQAEIERRGLSAAWQQARTGTR